MDIWYKQFIDLEKAQSNNVTTDYVREWGILYCNEQNPGYYDANHAYVELPIENPESVISEVITFYEQRGLIPRFYVKNVEKDLLFLQLLKEQGFQYEEFEDILQVWTGNIISIQTDENIYIEKVTDKNEQAACEVICGVTEMGDPEMRKRASTIFSVSLGSLHLQLVSLGIKIRLCWKMLPRHPNLEERDSFVSSLFICKRN